MLQEANYFKVHAVRTPSKFKKKLCKQKFFVYCLLLFFLAFLVNLTNSLLMLHSYFKLFFCFFNLFQW